MIRFWCWSLSGILSWATCAPVTAAESGKSTDFQRTIDIPYGKHEAARLDAYLNPANGVHRAIVYVHGGGFVTGDKGSCPGYLLKSAHEHGYSVFSVNYRLAPMYPFPAAIEDVSEAVRYVRSHAAEWHVDSEKMVLTGESAGGLISALTGVKLSGSDQVAAVIPICGEVDLELRVSENPCFMDMHMVDRPPGGCISKGIAAFLGFDSIASEKERKVVRAASTVAHIRPDMPPYLLVHGTRDFGVPYEQSVSLQQAMTKAGQDCTLLPVVGGGHVNWSNEQWDVVMDFVMKWLDARLARSR